MGRIARDTVRSYSQAKGSARAVLNIIADYAPDDGGVAWCSIATYAADTGLSERTVQRAIHRLVDDGEITIREGHGRGNVHAISVNLGPLKGDNLSLKGDTLTPIPEIKGDILTVKGDNVTPEPIEPYRTERTERSRARAQPLAEPGKLFPAGKGETPFHVYREVFTHTPTANQMRLMADTVDDLAKWRDICQRWDGAGYRSNNIAGLLDVYRNGWQQRNGTGSGKSDDEDKKRAALRSAQSRIDTARRVGFDPNPADEEIVERLREELHGTVNGRSPSTTGKKALKPAHSDIPF